MKKRKPARKTAPTVGASRWVLGWPYRVGPTGTVQVGSAKVGPFQRWTFYLFSYKHVVSYEDHEERDQCVLAELSRRDLGRGPGTISYLSRAKPS